MKCVRVWLLRALVLAGVGLLPLACAPTSRKASFPGALTRLERVDRALRLAGRFLVEQRSPDGSWRSDQYSPFKSGDALTPLVLDALRPLASEDEFAPAFRKGCDRLAALVKSDGSIDEGKFGLSYPVYTAALSVVVLGEASNVHHLKARDAWLVYLRRRQLTEDLGWNPRDKPYGGWGYSIPLPRKPRAADLTLPVEANLSATVFALDALRAAGQAGNDPAFQKALVFLQRRQNFEDERSGDPSHGGFTFIYDDGARNKAGSYVDQHGLTRFHSYGSTTADGLRGLLASRLPNKHARVAAARSWLETNFRTDIHPGPYEKVREPLRQSVYFYYCRSVARTLQLLAVRELATREGKVDWAEALADELLRRQDEKGRWINAADAQREDDPLVATSLAMSALAACREALQSTKSTNE
jgi:squalene-hopene/tetraprenyl-beta-curcumene cyclase